jgi:ketosteroid isomerase-like protein
MTDLAKLEARIDQLESRAAITELVTAYAVACDTHDIDLLSSLFTDDARFDTPSAVMKATGRVEITAMFERVLATRGPSFHWTHDVTIAFADKDRAAGVVLGHAETTPNGIASIAALHYDDEYRREGNKWKFSARSIQFLYYVPVTEFASACLTVENRLVVGGKRLPADFPERLPVWQAFARRVAIKS